MLKMFSSMIFASLLVTTAAQAQTLSQTKQFQYVDVACSISPKEFSGWFVSDKITKGGLVGFADSVNFPTDNTKCDFYKWAHQMFLWVTSPVDGGILLDSPTFFDMNAAGTDSSGFTFYKYIANSTNAPKNSFALRGTKPENIEPAGQAGGSDTLLSLNGSLVYFGLHANDVYAWFNTAMTNNALPANSTFPINQTQLNSVLAYASSNGATIGDGNALGMELKTAWIDASTLTKADVVNYVTISALVPNYVKTSSTKWTISTTTPAILKTLALVGIHVVGAVQNHPEMVWATFEHRSNAPDNTFYFNNLSGQTSSVPYNSTGQWNFMANGGTQQGALVAQMKVNSDGSISGTCAGTGTASCSLSSAGTSCQLSSGSGTCSQNTIQQNNVYRVNPWGNAPTTASAENNSELISLNLDILVMLGLVGDVRSNYFQVGAVWTRDGSVPDSPTDPELVGSLLLANSTMETYHQQGTAGSDQGCFGCHSVPTPSSASSTAPSTSVQTSHVFSLSNIPLVPAGSGTSSSAAAVKTKK